MNLLPIFLTLLVTSTFPAAKSRIQVSYPDEKSAVAEAEDEAQKIAEVLAHHQDVGQVVIEDDYDDEPETTTGAGDVTTTTTTPPDGNDFDGMSFLYGALAGLGGIVLIAAVVFVVKAVSKPSSDLSSFELNDYVTDDV